MIIMSHVRGGYHAIAAYLKAQGNNEKISTVDISDFEAEDLDEAFQNMWAVAAKTRAKKALHHISINPRRDERLTGDQLSAIVRRCELKYGYNHDDHQRVIVEHVKGGRQHFHVVWSRVSLLTGKPVWPGLHWNRSRQVAREMEAELDLGGPVLRKVHKDPPEDPVAAPFASEVIPEEGHPHPLERPVLSGMRHHVPHPSRYALLKPSPQTAQGQQTVSSMSREQWIDFRAACEHRMTWAQYFRKWGRAMVQE